MIYNKSSSWTLLRAIFVLCTLLIDFVHPLHSHRGSPSHGHHAVHMHAVREAKQHQGARMEGRTRSLNESVLAQSEDAVDRWVAANPQLATTIPLAKIDSLKRELRRRNNLDENLGEYTSPVEEPRPISARHEVTSSELQAARDLIRAAHVEVGAQNLHIRTHPRLNKYYFQDKASLLKARSEPVQVNSTVAIAAAIVAEADAAASARNGTIQTNYVLPDGFKSPPGHEGGNLQKRATAFWMETVGKEYPGSFPLDKAETNYTVWRNVKDYGAVGNGIKDDTAAINAAIAAGNRCGNGCSSTSAKGAVIYFPAGTYLVSTPIILYYNTQMIGNYNNLPIIKAAPAFTGLGVISSDVYLASGEWYLDTNNFYRACRNFIVDITAVTVTAPACVHWQVAQATSLENMYFYMVNTTAKAQVGIFSENGSGGFMADLTFKSGSIGLQCGNQQFTTRAMTFISCTTGISLLWDWGWTFKSVTITGAQYGITVAGTDVGGSVYLLDSKISSTGVGISLPSTTANLLTTNYLNIDNLVLSAVPKTITRSTTTVLNAGTTTIKSWVYGRIYNTANTAGKLQQGGALTNPHPMTASLGGGPNGGYFERSRPQYPTLAASAFINAKKYASGNGVADDTGALNMVFSVAASEGLAVYMPAGTYIVTDTVQIPSGSVVVGECWSQIMAKGTNFATMTAPHVMVRVGVAGGEIGTVEIQDLLYTVQGPTAGAVLLEWNINGTTAGAAAMWDSHFRVGGALGSNLQVANCPKLTGKTNNNCIAASLMLHLTKTASAYLENVWAWVADHDMDDQAQTQIDIYSARGILIESTGPCWLYGTASEHSVLYQYQLYQARDIFMSMASAITKPSAGFEPNRIQIQTESPYWMPETEAPSPFTAEVGYYAGDPNISGDCVAVAGGHQCFQAWALSVVQSTNIQIGGAGLYSWFIGYVQTCVDTQNCQLRLVNTVANTNFYMLNLYTIGSTQMVVPSGSNLGIAYAANNTNENAHPFLAVIAAWTDLSTTWEELCDWDDERDSCDDEQTLCDLTLTFTSLDTLQAAASGFPDFCLDVYALQVVSDQLTAGLASYTSVDNGYDSKFGYYVTYIKELIPKQLDEFMAQGAPGNAYFTCTYNADDGSANGTAQACPIEVDGTVFRYTVYYTPTNLTGFYAELLATYGIDPSWVQLGEKDLAVTCESDCGIGSSYDYTFDGYPIAASNIPVPNPKEIVTAALSNITTLQSNILATRLDILLGQWQGSVDDVVQVVSTPVFMILQAIDSMQNVKDIGTDVQDADKKNLILEIISIVFMFVPFIGEAAEAALGVANLARMIALIGAVGNTALSVVDIINDPSSAPMAIMGILMGATDFRNPETFATMATARRAMTLDDIAEVGTIFEANDGKLQNLVKACTK